MPRHDSTRSHGYKETANEWLDTAKSHPTATAAAAAGAAGAIAAGVYLWSKRSEISTHMHEWADKLQSSRTGRELMKTKGPNELSAIESSRKTASGKSAKMKSPRATGGQSRTAGQNMNAGRAGAESVSH